jgi:hypothetical protein
MAVKEIRVAKTRLVPKKFGKIFTEGNEENKD